MLVASENSLEVEAFNLTRKATDFPDSRIGGLYCEPDENFAEIEQSILKGIISNKENYRECDQYADFVADDIFIEESFDSLSDAKKFVRETFAKFHISGNYNKTDILNKLTFFYSFFKLKSVNCRFEILSGNSCKKFHFDNVKARIISTYAGPGTQIKLPTADEILKLTSGSSVILKGSQFPGFKPVTLHRSPPIEDTGFKRFLFIADSGDS